MRRFKHLSMTDRIRIESLLKTKTSPRAIADILGVHISTIYREMKRGVYTRLNTDLTTTESYSPDIAEERYRRNLAAKGAPLKIGNDHELAGYIESKIINDKYSPAAVLGEIRHIGLTFKTTICTSTLYSYIDKGVFLLVTNKHLLYKKHKKRGYRQVKPARTPRGESIEKRPEIINKRETFGHWEMDCVESKKKTKRTFLVLTERLTDYEIVIPIKAKTAECVVNALNNLERQYGKNFSKIFITITVDNGSEFSDCEGMEKSIRTKRKRTKMYYCHPYSSWERGSNENQNKMIRRHYPKGTDFTHIPAADIEKMTIWINNYPRGIFDYANSAELFKKHLANVL